MTKKDIIEIVAEQTGNKKNHTKIIVECVLETFIERLAKEKRIEIRNFGVFKVKDTPARVGRNPVTKEAADVSARRIVQFKAGKTMKRLVNQDLDGGRPSAGTARPGEVLRVTARESTAGEP